MGRMFNAGMSEKGKALIEKSTKERKMGITVKDIIILLEEERDKQLMAEGSSALQAAGTINNLLKKIYDLVKNTWHWTETMLHCFYHSGGGV